MQHRTPAIILKRTAFGEADWIVTFFSRHAGRLGGIAKSARRSMRRFGGALEPGSTVEISYVDRPASHLVRIEEARVERSVIGIVKSLERIAAMNRALELALAFLQEHQPAPDKFDILAEWLALLSQRDPWPAELTVFEFEWLSRCGYRPHLADCTSCGRGIADDRRWSFGFEHAGLVCSRCARGNCMHLTGEAIEGLASIGSGGRPAEAGAAAAGAVLNRYVEHILGRPLRAWNFGCTS